MSLLCFALMISEATVSSELLFENQNHRRSDVFRRTEDEESTEINLYWNAILLIGTVYWFRDRGTEGGELGLGFWDSVPWTTFKRPNN